MLTEHIVALLIQERDKLNRAIEALQGHYGAAPKRRGRPPRAAMAPEMFTAATSHTASAIAAAAEPVKTRKKRVFSAAQRKAASERMKQRWDAKRKAAVKPSRKKKVVKAV